MTPKKVLFVCTGNTCRSPMAAALLGHLLAERGGGELAGIEVESAGLAAPEGAAAAPQAVRVLAREGIDLSQHRARALTLEMVEGADLILTMTRGHKAGVLALAPQARGKVFALKEMVLGEEERKVLTRVEELEAAIEKKEEEFFRSHAGELEKLQEEREILLDKLSQVEAAIQDWEGRLKGAAARERGELADIKEKLPPLDISDPFGQPEEVYRSCLEELKEDLEQLLSRLYEV